MRIFQSTPPVWGATVSDMVEQTGLQISIHAPRVGGDRLSAQLLAAEEISIHAPRVGGDRIVWIGSSISRISIHAPRVGGDSISCLTIHELVISIHAPRVGGDLRFVRPVVPYGFYFNPRPPCGGRPPAVALRNSLRAFQSTPPVWGATYTLKGVILYL